MHQGNPDSYIVCSTDWPPDMGYTDKIKASSSGVYLRITMLKIGFPENVCMTKNLTFIRANAHVTNVNLTNYV